jgi:hypothetical protein
VVTSSASVSRSSRADLLQKFYMQYLIYYTIANEAREVQARLSALMESARKKMFDNEPPKGGSRYGGGGSLDDKVQSIAGDIKHMQARLALIYY